MKLIRLLSILPILILLPVVASAQKFLASDDGTNLYWVVFSLSQTNLLNAGGVLSSDMSLVRTQNITAVGAQIVTSPGGFSILVGQETNYMNKFSTTYLGARAADVDTASTALPVAPYGRYYALTSTTDRINWEIAAPKGFTNPCVLTVHYVSADAISGTGTLEFRVIRTNDVTGGIWPPRTNDLQNAGTTTTIALPTYGVISQQLTAAINPVNIMSAVRPNEDFVIAVRPKIGRAHV